MSKRTRVRGKRNHKLRTYDFLKSKPVLECQNWCLNLEGTLLLYNRGKCEKSAFKTMKKPSQCHEKHWTSKLWHMGQDLLHSSSVAHVQIRGIFLMQMAIGTCIHYWWFIRNSDFLTVFGLDDFCLVWFGEAARSIEYQIYVLDMGKDLLHSSSVAHVQIHEIILMQLAIGTCIHCLWLIKNNKFLQ